MGGALVGTLVCLGRLPGGGDIGLAAVGKGVGRQLCVVLAETSQVVGSSPQSGFPE